MANNVDAGAFYAVDTGTGMVLSDVTIGPGNTPAAAFIARHDIVRKITRLLLTPLVFGIEYGFDLSEEKEVARP